MKKRLALKFASALVTWGSLIGLLFWLGSVIGPQARGQNYIPNPAQQLPLVADGPVAANVTASYSGPSGPDNLLQEDGTPKYSNRRDFARHLFAGALWQVLHNQCMADVPNCPAWAKNHLDDRVNADLQFESEIRDAVQPVAP